MDMGDSSGNGNNGTIYDNATWVTEKSVNGLSFDGSDDYVSIPVMNDEKILIAAWFYKNSNDTTNTEAMFDAW